MYTLLEYLLWVALACAVSSALFSLWVGFLAIKKAIEIVEVFSRTIAHRPLRLSRISLASHAHPKAG